MASSTVSGKKRHSRVLLVSCALLLILPSCALAVLGAGAGAGYVIKRELDKEGALEAEVREDVDAVWLATIESLDILHDIKTDVVVQDFPREARAVIDTRDVTIAVEAYDLDRTILRVQARGPLGPDESVAQMVQDDIILRLTRRK
ncbi:MAG: hypothetical protein ACI9K5_003261 [Gammaproteobacteria bacterium]|jgi:hypothetical protein